MCVCFFSSTTHEIIPSVPLVDLYTGKGLVRTTLPRSLYSRRPIKYGLLLIVYLVALHFHQCSRGPAASPLFTTRASPCIAGSRKSAERKSKRERERERRRATASAGRTSHGSLLTTPLPSFPFLPLSSGTSAFISLPGARSDSIISPLRAQRTPAA